MTITGGTKTGYALKSPTKSMQLRPTTNRVRQALFQILQSSYLPSQSWENLIVADLFAGIGMLGVEALSRGADYVDFIEKNHLHARIIQENLRITGFTQQARVYTRSTHDFIIHTSPSRYDVVFLDPPYALFREIRFLDIIKLLKKTGILVYLHAKTTLSEDKFSLPNQPTWYKNETRKYGDTGVSIYTTVH